MSDIADPVEPKWDDNPPIIHEQPETWVYWNPHGQLVIRQRHGVYCDCEEPFLFLSIENVQRLIRALQQELACPPWADSPPEPRIEAETAEPLTSAERQRRYRQRRRGQQ
jgi:hypothetical protein